ncbi:MAG: phage replisome organizer N-terminal domain-containing protein [Candidatus Dehalobacter alkaniphilus]
MADVKWIKLVSDMFDNRKIKQIRSMPDSDAIIVIWMQILCLAGSTNNNGLVYFSKDIPYTDEMLATEFDRPITTIRLALSIFVKFGMIEIVNDVICVSNWEKYQSQARLETLREYDRDRKRNYRTKQKLIAQSVSNECPGQVPESPFIDIDKELDKENKKKNKDIGVFEKFAGENLDLLEALKNFEKMRKDAMKKPLTEYAKKLLINGLNELSSSGEDIIACLNQSTFNNWLGVFPLKEGSKNAANKKPDQQPSDVWGIKTNRL